MNQERTTLIYILGAGRSGSTILSTILGASKSIFNCADLMQIYEYGCLNKLCNDGKTIFESKFWSTMIKIYDPDNVVDFCDMAKQNHQIEHHRNFLSNYFNITNKSRVESFLSEQEKLVMAISEATQKSFIIDSSKYPGRGLLLSRQENIDVKIIYNIRDVRGVINSFSKNVQTSRRSLSALFYYVMVNSMSELVYWKLPKENRMRIRYEDLILNTNRTLDKLAKFLNLNLDDIHLLLENAGEINVGPVIEGNRMVKKRKIKLDYDDEWLKKIGMGKRLIYYLLSFPLMVLNRYKI